MKNNPEITDTEQKILESAQKVFVKKGKDGARMQEIADEAKINKSLLHYYYRSKDKLFKAVFGAVFSNLAPKSLNFLMSDMPLLQKIEKFTESYIDMVAKNPSIPLFIINELNRNPKGLADMFLGTLKQLEMDIISKFKESVEKAIINGEIKSIDYRHLFINVLSMSIFPAIARPLIQKVGFNDSKVEYDLFLESRKKEVAKFIINSIKA